MRLSLDAMGGDHAPAVTVDGAVQAARISGHEIILVGKQDLLAAELKKHDTTGLKISIHHASEVIEMDESPAQAVRQKKDSSLAVAARLCAEGKAEAFISAGNSGATMASALLYMGRLRGISRPAIATLFPTLAGPCAVLDVGANADCKPKHLQQFAIMGKVYMQEVFAIRAPRVGLLSIGEEESKGNELTLASFPLLKEAPINFIGNVEGRDIPNGTADVVVCDGFVGNIVLKLAEGISSMIIKLVKQEMKAHPVAWISLPFLWLAIKGLKKKLDYSEYGGAPLLGIDGVCIMAHGRSNAKAVKNALFVAARFAEKNVNDEIKREVENLEPAREVEERTVRS